MTTCRQMTFDRSKIITRFAIVLVALALSGCSALRRDPPAVDRSDDPRLVEMVESRLGQQPALQAGSIRVEVDGRVVVLHGSVNGLAAWQCALRTAQLVEGVQSVTDFLVIESGPREVECLTL